jgi:hypothetical protein
LLALLWRAAFDFHRHLTAEAVNPVQAEAWSGGQFPGQSNKGSARLTDAWDQAKGNDIRSQT